MGGPANACIARWKEESERDGPRCTAALTADWIDAVLHAKGVLTANLARTPIKSSGLASASCVKLRA